MSKLTGRYLARDLVTADLKGSSPLIENLLFERDNTILLGKEKSSKSILALQMACALSSGCPFLNSFNVPKPVDVVYLQAEGKLSGTRDNLLNMSRIVDVDLDRLMFLYYPSIPLDTKIGYTEIVSQINSWKRPEVIIIDPLYMAMSGDLKDDVASRRMVENMRMLSETYQATLVLVHHAHRPVRREGVTINEGDDAIFGSFVWKAFPDNLIMLEKVQGHKNNRRLSCSTQRTGAIHEASELVLIEPTPLYFELRGDGLPIDDLVLGNLDTEPMTVKMLSEKIKRTYHYVFNSLYRLQNQRKVVRLNPGKNPAYFIKT